MAPTPKQIIEAESIQLIEHITKFDRDEENFEICERFVLSNLLYHKYLDPDEKKIVKTIQGVKEKFLIHAQFAKAEKLEELVNRYLASTVFKQPQQQHDIQYRMLSLLLNLAENPVNIEYIPQPIEIEPEEEQQVDWKAILREGEPALQTLGSESDLSDWSEDSDLDHSSERFAPTVEGLSCDPGSGPEATADGEVKEWLRSNLQFPYWTKQQTFPANQANFAHQTESMLTRRGKLDVRTEKITEYQLIREIIWMLRAPADSPVFEFHGGGFRVTDLVTLVSVTDSSLQALLDEVLPSFAHVYTLKSFLHQIEHPGPDHVVPHSVEAYGSGINHVLLLFSQFLLQLEQRVMLQDDTLTVLMILDELRPWMKQLEMLRSIHDFATKDYFDATENWYKCMRILSVLYNSILSCTNPCLLDHLMEIFLMTLKPFLSILDTWLVLGALADHRQEFIFFRSDGEDSAADGWNNVFKPRLYAEKLAADGIQPIALFVNLAEKILVAGKSNEILSKMNRLGKVDRLPTEVGKSSIYTDFICELKSRLPKFYKNPDKIVSEETHPLETSALVCKNAEFLEIIHSTEDEFLAAAFSNIFVEAEQGSRAEAVAVEDRTVELGVRLDPLIPLESILSDSLSVGILKHYNRSCFSLVQLFVQDLKVEAELSKARQVFFMEAGDIMQDFNSQIFSIIHRRDTDLLDSSSLTLLLQDCLSQRFSSWVEKFSCSYTVPSTETYSPVLSLQGLTIHMVIAWPLNIILSAENLKIYNKIFLFLVTVKRSLWCLQSISLTQLAQLDKQMEKDEGSSDQLSDSSLSAGQKLHRLQLLRAWLLYFVTLLHGYFMSRVVHSTHLELSDGISGSTDLNTLIRVHKTYLNRIHDRCFLHPGVSMLKEAISKVLGICLEVHTGVTENSIHSRSIDTWEDKYARCHNFLASTLSTMVRKSKLPHLEGLAAALQHSLPQTQ